MNGERIWLMHAIRYGAAVGGLTDAACAVVDVPVSACVGIYVSWMYPFFIIGGYLLVGCLGGGVLGGLYAGLTARTSAAHDVHTRVRDLCLIACVAAFAAVFLERFRHGSEDLSGWTIGPSTVVSALIVLAGALLAAFVLHPFRLRLASCDAYVWQVVCVAMVFVLWRPLNQAYDAPLFSATSLVIHAAYLSGIAVVYWGIRYALRRGRLRLCPQDAC